MSFSRNIHALALCGFMACATLGTLAVDVAAPAEVHAQSFDTTYFYAALAPEGRWYYHYKLGWVWYPVGVQASWQPYTRGRWEWADEYGWTWASAEPWGWATYHYGRWYDDPHVGWVWTPGNVWGPAWVNWRVSDTHVGWAPLPPATFGHEIALTVNFGGGFYRSPLDFDRYNDWHVSEPSYNQFVFVDYNNFTTTHIDRVVIRDRPQRERLFRDARDMTRYDVSGDYGRYRGDFGREQVERRIGRQIRPVRIAEAREPGRAAAESNASGEIPIFRPRIAKAPKERLERVSPDRLGLAAAPDEQPKVDEIKQRRQRGEQKTAAQERKERGLKPLAASNPKELETEAEVGEQRLRKERSGRSPDAATEREGRERGGKDAGADTERGQREGAVEKERERGQRESAVEKERERGQREGAVEKERERGQREGAAEKERERAQREGAAEKERERAQREGAVEKERERGQREGAVEKEREQRPKQGTTAVPPAPGSEPSKERVRGLEERDRDRQPAERPSGMNRPAPAAKPERVPQERVAPGGNRRGGTEGEEAERIRVQPDRNQRPAAAEPVPRKEMREQRPGRPEEQPAKERGKAPKRGQEEEIPPVPAP